MRTPVGAKAVLYIGLIVLLGLILTTTLNDLLPNKLGLFLGYNSEAYVALLILCAWIDWARPRLQGTSVGLRVSIATGALLLGAGFLLQHAPWPSQFVTLNEALFGCAVAIPYLQQRRPSLLSTLTLIGLSVAIPAVAGGQSAFVTDMAEAFGVIVAVALVAGLIDAQLLLRGPVLRGRSLSAAFVVFVLMAITKVVTPDQPEGIAQNILFYVQRANEGLVVAIVMLCYFATRPTSPVEDREPVWSAS